jgi:hypothetical protein
MILVVMEAETGEEEAAAALLKSALPRELLESGSAPKHKPKAETGLNRCVTIDGSLHPANPDLAAEPAPLKKACELLEERRPSHYLDVVA